jgi:hypothetical protein
MKSTKSPTAVQVPVTRPPSTDEKPENNPPPPPLLFG